MVKLPHELSVHFFFLFSSHVTEAGGRMGIKQVKLHFIFYTNENSHCPAECEKIPIENLELDSPESIFVMILASFGRLLRTDCFAILDIWIYSSDCFIWFIKIDWFSFY